MKLTLGVGDFERLTKRAIQFAAKGKDIQPGYKLVLVEVTDKGVLRMSAHNAAAGTRVKHKLNKGFESGTICISADHLSKIVGILPRGHGNEVVIKTGRGPKVSVSCKSLRMSVPRAEIADFPQMPKPPRDGWFEVSDRQLDEVINRLLWAMCKDESRPALAGVHLCDKWSETCDGHLIARKMPGLVPEGIDVVVPGDAWHNLRSFVDGVDTKLRMTIENDRRAWMRGPDWAVFTTLIASKYPSTGHLIFSVDDDGFHQAGDLRMRVHWIHVNRKETIAVVSRIIGASVSQEEKSLGASVKFEVREGSLHFVSHYPIDDMSNSIIVDEQVDWAEGSVVADDLGGFDAMSGVGLYSTYMKMALESLSSDIIRVLWAETPEGKFVPVQFHDEAVGMKALVMPRRL